MSPLRRRHATPELRVRGRPRRPASGPDRSPRSQRFPGAGIPAAGEVSRAVPELQRAQQELQLEPSGPVAAGEPHPGLLILLAFTGQAGRERPGRAGAQRGIGLIQRAVCITYRLGQQPTGLVPRPAAEDPPPNPVQRGRCVVWTGLPPHLERGRRKSRHLRIRPARGEERHLGKHQLLLECQGERWPIPANELQRALESLPPFGARAPGGCKADGTDLAGLAHRDHLANQPRATQSAREGPVLDAQLQSSLDLSFGDRLPAEDVAESQDIADVEARRLQIRPEELPVLDRRRKLVTTAEAGAQDSPDGALQPRRGPDQLGRGVEGRPAFEDRLTAGHRRRR